MAVVFLSENVIRQILLSGRAGARLLNENAVQIDVWSAFGLLPDKGVDLLLTPHDATPAPALAHELHRQFRLRRDADGRPAFRRLITPLEGTVAACLSLDDFVFHVLPMTGLDLAACFADLATLLHADMARSSGGEDLGRSPNAIDLIRFARAHRVDLAPDLRATLLAILLLTMRQTAVPGTTSFDLDLEPDPALAVQLAGLPLAPTLLEWRGVNVSTKIWRVARNRPVQRLGVSVETIKADAAHRLFEIDCRTLTWAVIDSGIDGAHPAFRDHERGNFASRVDKAYDFGRLREIAAYDTLSDDAACAAIVQAIESKLQIDVAEAHNLLGRLRQDADDGRPFDWEKISRLIEVATDQLDAVTDGRPEPHGTHVAGVLGGDWRENDQSVFRGVCPDIRFYDLRVLGPSTDDTEFAVIAALEFVRWLNARNRYITVHGVNLSIGLVHDRANFACGRTPVCLACEATVASGVTVVAAAGNWGSQSYVTADGPYLGYAAISIADPGNAASVITVGATHRERPHEYGVSFFSSRGPTADGRPKPDVVAPGERIDGPLPNLGLGRLDGTSMAAPHVSGVAALLMARYPELIGNPARIKSVIMSSATDLGREKHFQGAGLVDALRALQAL